MTPKFEVGDEVLYGSFDRRKLALREALGDNPRLLWRVVNVRASGAHYDICPVLPIKGCSGIHGVEEDDLHRPGEFRDWDKEEL